MLVAIPGLLVLCSAFKIIIKNKYYVEVS